MSIFPRGMTCYLNRFFLILNAWLNLLFEGKSNIFYLLKMTFFFLSFRVVSPALWRKGGHFINDSSSTPATISFRPWFQIYAFTASGIGSPNSNWLIPNHSSVYLFSNRAKGSCCWRLFDWIKIRIIYCFWVYYWVYCCWSWIDLCCWIEINCINDYCIQSINRIHICFINWNNCWNYQINRLDPLLL